MAWGSGVNTLFLHQYIPILSVCESCANNPIYVMNGIGKDLLLELKTRNTLSRELGNIRRKKTYEGLVWPGDGQNAT